LCTPRGVAPVLHRRNECNFVAALDAARDLHRAG
jgi:hypothetical protein